MKMLLKYLGVYKRGMFFSYSVKIIATLAELALPYILSHIIDGVIKPLDGQTSPDTAGAVTKLVIFALLMVLCAATALCGNIFANRKAAWVAQNVARAVRTDLFTKTMSLSPSQVDLYTVPSLESRLTTDTYNIHHFMNVVQRMGIRAPIMLVGGLCITATLDLTLTAVMACVLPFIFAAVYGISVKGMPMFRESQKAVDGMVKVVREDAQGIRVIKALSKSDYEANRYDSANRALADKEKKANLTMAAANPIMNLFMNLGLTAVVFFGALRVNKGLTGAGEIVAFIQYFTLISMAMLAISRLFVITSKAMASAKRITEILETEADLLVVSEEKIPDKADAPFISFENLSFSYNDTKTVLHNISFTLEKGQALGIIGGTGSGKTTLAALLMRLYDVDEGCVRIDGMDVRTLSKEKLYSYFGAALQNDFIFAGTIEENIDFFRELDFKRIKSSAVSAVADEYITRFEDGYGRELTAKGNNLSGGQKQRLLIARALAGEGEILILDDCSSALDYKTESVLRRNLREAFGGKTTVTVSQRVSSVMNCDKIIVLNGGRITAMGTHEELLERCLEYKEISDSQMGGAILD